MRAIEQPFVTFQPKYHASTRPCQRLDPRCQFTTETRGSENKTKTQASTSASQSPAKWRLPCSRTPPSRIRDPGFWKWLPLSANEDRPSTETYSENEPAISLEARYPIDKEAAL